MLRLSESLRQAHPGNQRRRLDFAAAFLAGRFALDRLAADFPLPVALFSAPTAGFEPAPVATAFSTALSAG